MPGVEYVNDTEFTFPLDDANLIPNQNEDLSASAATKATNKRGRKKKEPLPSSVSSTEALKLPKPKDDPLSAEDDSKKADVLMSISTYLSSPVYADDLKTFGFKMTAKLAEKNIAELESHLQQIRRIVSNIATGDSVTGLVKGTMKTAENLAIVVSAGQLKVQGTTEACFNDKNWLRAYEAFRLEKLNFTEVNSTLRLVMITANMAAMTHAVNT